MSDLISRSAFAELMCRACNEYFPDEPCEPSECDLRMALANAPTVDAVPVVRCKDCKHYTPVEGGKPLCALHSIAVAQDDFCSYGERKDDGV